MSPTQTGRGPDRQIRPVGSPNLERMPRHLVPMGLIPCLQEKLLARTAVPVPQTDTGRREEDSKAIERSVAKELGKISP